MTSKPVYLVDLIFKKLKEYKAKQIFPKENLKNSYFHFLKKTRFKEKYNENCYIKRSLCRYK